MFERKDLSDLTAQDLAALGLKAGTPVSKLWVRALRLVGVGLALHAVAMWGYDKADFRV